MNTLLIFKPFAGYVSHYAKKLAGKAVMLFSLFVIVIGTRTSAQQNGYPSLTFHSPVLISGTPNQVGAVYLFPNVCTGVDANITIMGIFNGASLNNIDDTAGVGYYDAFQPYVTAAPNDSSYIDWKIEFKVAGTTTDTILPKVAVTGIDVDGDGASLKEFIRASTPGTFGLDPSTFLHYTFDGVNSEAISTVDNFPLIDTNQRKAMFQMNFKNVSSLLYRNGAVSTKGSVDIRQTCIYFKSFFAEELILPVKLITFTADPQKETVVLKWSATNEENLASYSVQKSTDGNSWKNISTVAAGLSKDGNDYLVTDVEKNQTTVYYRLKQTATNGVSTYSKTIKVSYKAGAHVSINHNTVINNDIRFQISTSQSDDYTFNIYSVAGRNISQTENKIYAGANNFVIVLPHLSQGVYILAIKNKDGQLLYDSKLVKN
jgi:hypothetical protein